VSGLSDMSGLASTTGLLIQTVIGSAGLKAVRGSPVPLFVFTGESNAAGYALNTGLSAAELAARPSVQILNNTSLVFEDLDVATNNSIGLNTDLTVHGLEAGLANMVEAGRLSQSSVYLVKSAYAGSRIDQWESSDTHWLDWLERVDAALTALATAGVNYTPIIIYSQGINDATVSTDPATWRSATENLFARMRAVLGARAPILCTELPLGAFDNLNIADYNTQLDAIAAADSLVTVIDTADCGMRDNAHWNAAGFRLMGERILDALATQDGPAVTASVAAGTYEAAQTVALSTADGSAIRYTTSGTDPDSTSTLYETPVEISVSATLKARSFKAGRRLGPVLERAYTISLPTLKWDASHKSAHITLYSDDTEAASTGGTSLNAVGAVTSKSTGKYYFEIELSAYLGSSPNNIVAGIGTQPQPASGNNWTNNSWPGSYATSFGVQGGATTGTLLRNGMLAGTGTTNGCLNALNDVLGFAVDADAGKIWVAKNNSWGDQDPGAGTNPITTFTAPKAVMPVVALFQNNPGNKVRLRTGTSCLYTPPTGFSATW
jgi:hypothetical protein